MVFLAVLALIFIGPKQLPELARVIGRFMTEMRRATQEFGSTFTDFKRESQKFLSETHSEIEDSIRLDQPEDSMTKTPNDPPQPENHAVEPGSKPQHHPGSPSPDSHTVSDLKTYDDSQSAEAEEASPSVDTTSKEPNS